MAMVSGAADQLRRRRESFALRAEEWSRKVGAAYMDEQSARVGNHFNFDPRTTTAYYQLVKHYTAMREKYEQAAARPWSVVGPDLPEPDWPKGVPRLVAPVSDLPRRTRKR
jgi:hypothetical protein